MAQWIKTDGTIQEVRPKNGRDYKLDELKEYIGGGYIQVIYVGDKVIVIDEEGKLKNFPTNVIATVGYKRFLFSGDFIVGDVLVCKSGEIE